MLSWRDEVENCYSCFFFWFGSPGKSQKFAILNWVKFRMMGDIPGGPVVKTLLPSAGGAGSIPGRGTKNPHAWRPKAKTWNGNSIVTNSIKTLKVVHIKKKKSLKKNLGWWERQKVSPSWGEGRVVKASSRCIALWAWFHCCVWNCILFVSFHFFLQISCITVSWDISFWYLFPFISSHMCHLLGAWCIFLQPE